ncbi:MAG: hypothetical protein WBA67_07175 [Jannaschia sp.]
MLEAHTTRTYEEAFARARRERALAFRALFTFTFRVPRLRVGRAARHA